MTRIFRTLLSWFLRSEVKGRGRGFFALLIEEPEKEAIRDEGKVKKVRNSFRVNIMSA